MEKKSDAIVNMVFGIGKLNALKRGVGKFIGMGRGVAKAMSNANQMAKHTLGIDPMKMAQERGVQELNTRAGQGAFKKIKEGYQQGERMYRDVQGGDYQGALQRGHNMGMKHSQGYQKYGAGAMGMAMRYM